LRASNSTARTRLRRLGLPRKDVGAMDAVFPGCSLLGGRPEAIKSFQDADLFKPHPLEDVDHLCLRQSAGNSTRPEVDVSPSVFREFDIQQDVGHLKSATRPEHAHDFREGALLLGHEIEHAIGDDRIDALILDRQ